MSQLQREIRPAGELSGFSGDQSTDSLQFSLPMNAADPLLDGVLVVVVELPDEKRRRRIFLSLHTAQRHADRARAAGREATVWLAQLAPVTEVAL
ncbi:hypothetical protein [Tessaracoccus massiliensis]|uniref:hypothetical protein n=1 Tax=Tessaracoccus massiliensis TaxID=1522311 RepID=UPI0011192FF8|nr:hypothetical protein [Tessaracoccus massiliensis]